MRNLIELVRLALSGLVVTAFVAVVIISGVCAIDLILDGEWGFIFWFPFEIAVIIKTIKHEHQKPIELPTLDLPELHSRRE